MTIQTLKLKGVPNQKFTVLVTDSIAGKTIAYRVKSSSPENAVRFAANIFSAHDGFSRCTVIACLKGEASFAEVVGYCFAPIYIELYDVAEDEVAA